VKKEIEHTVSGKTGGNQPKALLKTYYR